MEALQPKLTSTRQIVSLQKSHLFLLFSRLRQAFASKRLNSRKIWIPCDTTSTKHKKEQLASKIGSSHNFRIRKTHTGFKCSSFNETFTKDSLQTRSTESEILKTQQDLTHFAHNSRASPITHKHQQTQSTRLRNNCYAEKRFDFGDTSQIFQASPAKATKQCFGVLDTCAK